MVSQSLLSSLLGQLKVTETAYIFLGFKFAPALGRLRAANNESITLRRKTSDLLEHLLTNAGRLVSRHDLLDSVWGDTNINEEGLTNCIFEARQALGDDPRHPQFIETVHGRGYRFIAPVTRANPGPEQQPSPTEILAETPVMVGREKELRALENCWKRCLDGRRGLALITGEQGIGKTALADALLATVRSSGLAFIGRGQCFASSAKDESYLPIFEALGQMCRGAYGAEVREILTRFAPSWTSRMPEIFGVDPNNAQERTVATSSTSMLREFTITLEMLASTRPTLLICEDLHRADQLTLELLAYLAQRRETANLLVIGTCRPLKETDSPHLYDVLSCLGAQASCVKLEVAGLSHEAISFYLHRRLPNGSAVESIARQLSLRTGGNPMLVAHLVDDLAWRLSRRRGDLLRLDQAYQPALPENVRIVIEQQLQNLSEADRQVLCAASVAATGGTTFSAAAVCAVLGDSEFSTLESVEARCDALARDSGILRACGVSHWPDATSAGAYSFSRSVFQEVLYCSINPGGRARMHLRIADRLEKSWRGNLSKIRGDLATHLERAGDHTRAARYKHAGPTTAALARTLPRAAVA